MNSIAMSNEAAIDWFARNVHEWPSRGEVAHCWPPSGVGLPEYISLTKDQWLARRAELQNKPRWQDAPEWALSVTQRVNGEWFWLGSVDQFKGPSTSTGCVGAVLGDWRDTLERRPEHTRSEMEVELVKAAFKPFISIAANQELNVSDKQEMKQDNGWFERGEFLRLAPELM